MKNKGIINTISNAFATLFFIKYILPILVILFIVLVCITKVNSNNMSKQYEANSVIMKSNLASEIVDIANAIYDKNEVTLEIERFNDMTSDIVLNYTMLNKDYSIEQYSSIIKNEITKLYEKLKNKDVVEDRLFVNKDDIVNEIIKLRFSLNGDSYYTGLFSDTLKYDSTNKWDKSYNLLMSKQLVTEDSLTKAKANLLSK